MTATPTQTPQRSTVDSPVDDATYDVLMALASKLEAIDTYRKYADDGQNAELWQQLAKDDRRHADLLLDELRGRLTTNR
jgi:rubrerythrin